jgi:hypothetical protein
MREVASVFTFAENGMFISGRSKRFSSEHLKLENIYVECDRIF